MPAIANRYDFVALFDVANGNPNGDPDAGNLPRLDPETNHGLVTDVCLKRKIRNFTELAKSSTPGYAIYVQESSILNEKHRMAYVALRPDDAKAKTDKKLNPKSDDEANALRNFMCENFFDVRTFGAVMSTGVNCGQVRGPVQLSFATSIEPVVPLEISITRMAATNEAEKAKKTEGADDERTENRTMGRKYIIPYGLYRAHGFVSAKLAEKTGFSDTDLDFLWEALKNAFEHDRSAARGEMAMRKLIVFKHDSALGKAPAHSLFERIVVGRNVDGDLRAIDDRGLDNLLPARRFADYKIEIDRSNLPEGVEILEMLFCNGPRLVNPFLRHPIAGSLFCPWSAHGRHLMGLDEDEAGQSNCAWSLPPRSIPRSDLVHRPGEGTSLREGWCCDPPENCYLVSSYAATGLRAPTGSPANEVPSTHIRCRMTPSLRASATFAFFMPARAANFIAQLFSELAPLIGRVRIMLAAS